GLRSCRAWTRATTAVQRPPLLRFGYNFGCRSACAKRLSQQVALQRANTRKIVTGHIACRSSSPEAKRFGKENETNYEKKPISIGGRRCHRALRLSFCCSTSLRRGPGAP